MLQISLQAKYMSKVNPGMIQYEFEVEDDQDNPFLCRFLILL